MTGIYGLDPATTQSTHNINALPGSLAGSQDIFSLLISCI